MADPNERDTKLIQYLNEAYGKEMELETALQAHIGMTTKPAYKKRLQQHLRETKSHAKGISRRIKQLGGGGHLTQTAVGKAMAAAKGPLHMVRGTGEQEKMLKNAKTEYFNEHEEIATYLAIETLAQRVGDRETARLAKDIRRDEERMAKFLEGQIKTLTGAVVAEEVPRAQRSAASNGGRRRAGSKKRAAAKSATGGARSAKASSSRKRSTAKRSTAKRSSAKRKPTKATSKSSRAKGARTKSGARSR
jgi:ferritin-like metal-binding protein YciE